MAIAVYRMSNSTASLCERMEFPDSWSMNDIQLQIPQGVYTTFRTYQSTRVFPFSQHVSRLEESATLVGRPISLHEAVVRSHLRSILRNASNTDSRIRISVDLTVNIGSIFILVEPLRAPSKHSYRQGVQVVTRFAHRENPQAKTTSFVRVAESTRHQEDHKVNEVIMLSDDGEFLEGLSSNFFAIYDGEIWTAGMGVLPGITRKIVLEIVQGLGYPIRLVGISARELPLISEAFLTSASREVLPIRQIDGQVIGDGRPGQRTRSIMRQWRQYVEDHTEEI